MNNVLIWLSMLLMTILGSVASFFLKNASGTESVVKMFENINLYIGGGLYIVSAILNIIVLRFFDYSVVLPMTSLTYIWTILISCVIFKENITKKTFIGVIAIFVGALMVAV